MTLRHRADRRTLACGGLWLATLIVAWLVVPVTALPLATVILAGLSFMGAVATHNAMHRPVFRDRWANRLFRLFLTLWGGQTVSAYVPGHNLSHHRYLQTPRDYMRTTRARWSWNLLNGLFYAVTVRNVFVAEIRYAWALRHRRPDFVRQYLAEYVVLIGVFGLALVLDPLRAVALLWVPAALSIWGIITINFVQHDGCDPDDPMQSCRNFMSPALNGWLFNNGYHTIHHLNPALHWSELPAAHQAEVAPHIDPRLEEPSLLGYLWRSFGWPGQRLHYTGSALALPPDHPDEDWHPAMRSSA